MYFVCIRSVQIGSRFVTAEQKNKLTVYHCLLTVSCADCSAKEKKKKDQNSIPISPSNNDGMTPEKSIDTKPPDGLNDDVEPERFKKKPAANWKKTKNKVCESSV